WCPPLVPWCRRSPASVRRPSRLLRRAAAVVGDVIVDVIGMIFLVGAVLSKLVSSLPSRIACGVESPAAEVKLPGLARFYSFPLHL
ncbi:hypothetical protein, partial [Klebsiella pneumoniae]|uniref:hypothetical protein n=1 Tax=Klebsiella pneumoniae TaxID=573 RepID=UPI003B5A0EC0